MIELASKQDCTGCAACQNICTKHAISLIPDAEGFNYPIINDELCINCGLCKKKCPVLNPISVNLEKQTAYALISSDDRTVSSSGGAFSVFAKMVLAKKGIVYGASIDDDFHVKHIGIESVDDLALLRGSKYVQSEVSSIFTKIKDDLKSGRQVLFSGTGCQVAGLYSFLGSRYDGQLITLDLVCHGVPSQGAFDAYIEKLKKSSRLKGENIKEFRFRKFDSWDYRPAIKLAKSEWRILTLSENAYMDAFFEGIIFRESCFHCKLCNTQRVGTYTIADFWGIGRHGNKFSKNVASGVSLVIDNQNRLESNLTEIKKYAYVEKRSMSEAVAEQTNLQAPMRRLPIRDQAVKLLIDPKISLTEFSKFCGLPYKATLKYVIIKISKDIIYALGLYNVYKTIIYKLGKS